MRENDNIYNVVVIGAGTAGLVTAAGTAGLGGRVALIERNRMGGDCLNFGCVPSKALISSARTIHRIRCAPEWGLEPQEPRFAFEKVLERMRQRRTKIEPNDSEERFESLGVDVFRNEAHFVSPHSVQVDGRVLRAKNIVIATGSRAKVPQINGLSDVPYFTNETIFDELHSKPESMIILGGGPIGCELGQTLGRLGVRVTIISHGPQLLSKEDQDVAEFLQERLVSESVTIAFNTEIEHASMRNGKVYLGGVQKQPDTATGVPIEFTADTLLLAAGRTPNIETLNLSAAGVSADKHGIEVNQYLQTSQPHIYAAGDVAGSYQFTHTADAMARVVVRNILMPAQFLRQRIDLSVVPWATYTDPEIAHVGLTKKQAHLRGLDFDVYRFPIEEVDRAVLENEDSGFVEVLTCKGTDEILGVNLVAAHAGDLLHEFVLAMKHRIGLGKIAATIHAYPTFAELARKAGDRFNRTRLTPRAKRIFEWLYARARNNVPNDETFEWRYESTHPRGMKMHGTH